MIWIILVVILLAALVPSIAWWGSNVLFHPPLMLYMAIWPEKYGLSYEKVRFTTADGVAIKGWLIEAQTPTDRTLLMCHGWGDNKGALLQHTYFLHKRFNLFYFDFRHHGESEGERCTNGYLETLDVEAALKFLETNRPSWTKHLGVYGLSMGATLAVLAAVAHQDIKAVAIEAPFNSFNKVIAQWTLNKLHLPYFPVSWFTLITIRYRLGIDPETVSPRYHVSRISPRPLFIIAGGEDRLMPLPVIQELYAIAQEPKELWVVPGAAHAKCEEVAGQEYHRRLSGFFEKNLN